MIYANVNDWADSDDAEHVECSANGVGRGDGYDVDVFRSRSTRRYLVRVWHVRSRRASWFVAETLAGARTVGRAGWTPGTAPGLYIYSVAPDRLREVRALHAQRRDAARAAAAAEPVTPCASTPTPEIHHAP